MVKITLPQQKRFLLHLNKDTVAANANNTVVFRYIHGPNHLLCMQLILSFCKIKSPIRLLLSQRQNRNQETLNIKLNISIIKQRLHFLNKYLPRRLIPTKRVHKHKQPLRPTYKKHSRRRRFNDYKVLRLIQQLTERVEALTKLVAPELSRFIIERLEHEIIPRVISTTSSAAD